MKKRRKNPARIERSQIRLEKFLKKKANDKNQAENSLGNQAVGSSPSRLVIDLNKQEGEKELFPAKNAQLVSCIAPRPMQSADQECIVVIKKVTSEDVSWPEMDSEQS